MILGFNRRHILAACSAIVAAPSAAWATTKLDRERYRKATVIDGNLALSIINGNALVDAATAARVRISGLTAMKQTLGGSNGSFADANSDISDTEMSIARNSHLFSRVRTVADIGAAKHSGHVAVIFSFESADMHEGRPERVDHFRSCGVLVMGLSYNLQSAFGSGVMTKDGTGLTIAGREAITRMNAAGITLDLSHSDELTSSESLRVTNRPALITHAGCYAVHPHPRNKSDKLLRAVAACGGTVGIYDLSYLGNYPANPTLDIYMRHLTHALAVCGEEHVGIGSDTDFLGIDTSAANLADWNKGEAKRKAAGIMAPEEGPLPYVEGLNGPFRWQVIASELTKRGYSSRIADKVLGTNLERVFRETW
ncbi:dipeptidase [Glacieibacterium megasporae]|uniref:dipeptidase n=1 Tax=Glacieibacterium megasporae TaxID=2835787 RepID=UPI001C1E5902|nr:membrane dipeptidase [Polymorphobacter megasporae]UAJ10499.1 membrane dipeptidase [Polymorphobacter megasporae]